MSSIEPGWYRDPGEPDTQRYWDGEQWIGTALPVDAAPPEGPPEPEPEPPVSFPDPTNGLNGPTDPAWAPPPAGVTPIDRRPPTGQAPGRPSATGFPWAKVDLGGQVLAGPGLRLAARLIDAVAVLLLNVVVSGYFIYQYFQEIMPVVDNAMRTGGQIQLTDISERASNLQLTIMLIGLLLWFAYEVPLTTHTGQTLGKKMVGIKVVPLFGQPLRMFPMAMRWSMMALPFLFLACGIFLLLVDALWCLRDRPYRQCLHDKSPGTTVVLATEAAPAPRLEGDTDVSSSDPR